MARSRTPAGASPRPAGRVAAVEANAGDVENALDDASAAAAAGDAEEFEAAIQEAQDRLEKMEGDITWLKTEVTKQGEATTPIRSTLEGLSSQMTDLKARMEEMTDKFQSLAQPTPSAPPAADPAAPPPAETPGVQAAVPPAPAPTPIPAEPAAATPSAQEPPKRKLRFI